MLRLSPVALSGGYSLVLMCGLLIVVTTFLVAEHRLQRMQASEVAACGAQWLRRVDSRAQAQ